MPIGSENRLIDANLNRLREGIRVLEDIARYILNDLPLASSLKTLRHKARVSDLNHLQSLLQHRDIKNDILKTSTPSEKKRENLRDIALANFKRSEESARVLEEIFKLDSLKDFVVDLGESSDFGKSSESREFGESNGDCGKFGESREFSSANRGVDSPESGGDFGAIAEIFKSIRYELYDIEIAYFKALDKV